MSLGRPRLTALSLLAGMLALGAGAGSALAQSEAPQQPPAAQSQPPAAQSEQVSDESLKIFASAMKEVNRIADKARTELQQSDQPEKAQEVQQKAQAEMVDAVQKKGLSVEQYNQIAMAAQSDPKVREKVLQHMQGAE